MTNTPARLSNLPSRLLAGAALVADRVVSEHLSAEKARKWHFAVLAALADGGPASQSELSRRTGIYRSDMVSVLNDLGDNERIRRSPDPADGRRNVITVTALGFAWLERLELLIAQAQEEILAPLTSAQRDQLVELLRLLTDHHRPDHAASAQSN